MHQLKVYYSGHLELQKFNYLEVNQYILYGKLYLIKYKTAVPD